jgi:hypothetical protein
MVGAGDVNTFPVIDPIGTVAASADTSNVDTVLVAGKARKRGGRLVGVDLPARRSQVQRSRDYVHRSRSRRGRAGRVPALVVLDGHPAPRPPRTSGMRFVPALSAP